MEYRTEEFAAELPVADYVARFRDPERIMGYCRECGNYGRSWACPPFGFDPEAAMRRYRIALLTATKIIPLESGIPLSRSRELIRPERVRLENRLRAMERLFGGRAFAYAGTCLYCPEGMCARLSGEPCRHAELVRPSLEACGFDICRTVSELFGFELLWSRDGFVPEYLTLVCGFFHNAETVTPVP